MVASGTGEKGVRDPEGSGGWRSQALWLKVLLFVSLSMVVVGVYRCSVELTPVTEPGTVRVAKAEVAVPSGFAGVPPDSLAVLATRVFARELGAASGAVVVVGDSPDAWAVVRLRVRAATGGGVGDRALPRIELTAAASSVVGGRTFAAFTGFSSPDSLRELAAAAARSISSEMRLLGDRQAGKR